MNQDVIEQLSTTSVWETEIIDAIGMQDTLKLEQAFGPGYLYIPAKCPTKAIVEAIGVSSAIKLVKIFGSGDIWVPRLLITQYRNIKIVDGLQKKGKTITELAEKFKMTERNIRKILQKHKD